MWETFAATGKGRWWNAFLVRHQPAPQDPDDRFVLSNEQGDLIFAQLTPQG